LPKRRLKPAATFYYLYERNFFYMKVYGRRPRLPMDSRGRLSYIFMLRGVCQKMTVGMKTFLATKDFRRRA
jgi:hypothetical protein